MNVEVRVGSINIGLSAKLVKPTLTTSSKISVATTITHTQCVVSTVISINGHSLSAVNPDRMLIGGETTLVTA